MKLFVVEIKSEIVVYADSPEEAELVAEDVARDCHDFEVAARDLVTLPADWTGDEHAYMDPERDDADKTINELIKEGAAPKWRWKV